MCARSVDDAKYELTLEDVGVRFHGAIIVVFSRR